MDAWSILGAALQSDPGRPLLTMYDDAPALGSERIELSVTTFANWVSKTANFLVDELTLEPGEPVAVPLPAHWQTAVIEAAVLVAGGTLAAAGTLIATGGSAPARITCWLEGTELPSDPAVEEIVGLALRPMGLGLRSAPPGVLDYAVDVRAHGDHFSPRYPAAEVDVTPLADRVLTDRLDPLWPALAGGGSLVLCRHPDPAALSRRAEMERVTATVGLTVMGLPQLG
ncbi:MAG TPA: TIGR03089 family protein [Frankiaceae bacterium]|jgi:uncharacterized protein (TIGR03089 family)|nr:TIGR03089 family protein [Frankiaceae bacterium]